MKNILIADASRGAKKVANTTLSNNGYNCITPSREEFGINSLVGINDYFELFKKPILLVKLLL